MARAVLLLLLAASSVLAQTGYTPSMYRRALENNSTAPSYVLVWLRDSVTDQKRLVCIPAPFLLGAIHREYQFAYDENGMQEALSFALAQPDRAFSFTDAKARANVQVRYTPEALSKIRDELSSMSDSELRDEVRKTNSLLQGADRDAVAQVLLERGILVGIMDRSGGLYVAE